MTVFMRLKIAILLYFVVFAAFFVLVVPPFESPDELGHLAYINFVATRLDLPNQYMLKRTDRDYVSEGHQPPLYYAIVAIFNRALLRDHKVDVTPIHNKNKVDWGGRFKKVPTFNHAYNNIFTSWADRASYYLIRLLSVLIGLINIYFVFKLTRLFLKDSLWALFPAFFMATLPQFVFISGMVNNDNLASLFGTIFLYYCFRLLGSPAKTRNYVLAGLFLGLGIFTKLIVFPLLLGMLPILVYSYMMNEKVRSIIAKSGLSMMILAVLTSSGFFIRNMLIYGELFGTRMVMRTDGAALVHVRSLFDWYFIYPFLPGLFVSFVGALGLLTLLLPIPVYLFYAAVMLSAIIGLLMSWSRNIQDRAKIIFAMLFVVLSFASMIYFNLKIESFQGRYLFPVLPLMAILIMIGLREIAGKIKSENIRNIFIGTIVAGFILIDLITIVLTCYFYYNPAVYL
jgi:4-amino-4-deoxy-L-arabinose transferase-like glycosyltransferase